MFTKRAFKKAKTPVERLAPKTLFSRSSHMPQRVEGNALYLFDGIVPTFAWLAEPVY